MNRKKRRNKSSPTPAADDKHRGGERVNLQLGHVFAAVDAWLKRQDAERDAPEPRSSLFEDDRRCDGYQLSQIVKLLLASAVDHLHALRGLLVDAEMLHRCAPTLIRPALENACVAVWLLTPSKRNQRVLRRLRLQYWEFQDGYKVHELMHGEDADWLESRKAKLLSKAEAAGLDATEKNQLFNRRTGYGTIVRSAGDAVPELDTPLVEICWRACSGISHGNVWATLSVNQTEKVRTAAEDVLGTSDVLGVNLSANEQAIESMTITAATMIDYAWKLLDRQSTSHGPQ